MKGINKIFKLTAVLTILSVISSFAVMRVSAAEEYRFDFALNSGYAAKFWGGVNETQNDLKDEYAIIGNNAGSGRCIQYGYYEGANYNSPGKKISIPAGDWDVYVNAGTVYAHTWTLEGIESTISSAAFEGSGGYGTYREEKIGTVNTTKSEYDSFTLKITGDGAWAKYIVFRPAQIEDGISTYLHFNSTQTAYGYRGWSGTAVGEKSAQLKASEVGGALTFGDCSSISGTAGSSITIPKGSYNVYINAASVNPHIWTITDLGSVLTSAEQPASGGYGTFCEEYIGSYKSDGSTYKNITVKGSIPLSKYDSTFIKYMRFEPVKIEFRGSTVALSDSETKINADMATDGEAFEFSGSGIVLGKAEGRAVYTLNSPNGGFYELYADTTSSGSFSHTIEVNGKRQPSMASAEKTGVNFLGYVSLAKGENTLAIEQNQGSCTLSSITLKYASEIPSELETVHFDGDAVSGTGGNFVLNNDTKTVKLYGGTSGTRAMYTGSFSGGEYEVYINASIPSAKRRATISLYTINGDTANDITFGSGYSVVPEATGSELEYRNINIGRYKIDAGENTTIRISDFAEQAHQYVYGGGDIYIRDVYFVKDIGRSDEDSKKLINYVWDDMASADSIDENEQKSYTVTVTKPGVYNVNLLYGAQNEAFDDAKVNSPAIEVIVNGVSLGTKAIASPNRTDSFNLRADLGDIYLKSGDNELTLVNKTTNTSTASPSTSGSKTEKFSSVIDLRQIVLKKSEAELYVGYIEPDYMVPGITPGTGADAYVRVIMNNSFASEDISLIYALYKDGNFVWADVDNMAVTGNRDILKAIPESLTNDDNGEYEVKVMIWDGLKTLKPLAAAEVFK